MFLVIWPQGMWDPSSGPGIKPQPLALESEVLTTGPPGEFLDLISNLYHKSDGLDLLPPF